MGPSARYIKLNLWYGVYVLFPILLFMVQLLELVNWELLNNISRVAYELLTTYNRKRLFNIINYTLTGHIKNIIS